jgi:3-hydroxybutyryl-CoA dehydrogenase
MVIEATPEEMETKLEIFTLLDKFARPGAILASTTSSLAVSEIATITFRAEHCVGMHFFIPVPNTKLLEVVRALETSDETIFACTEVGRRMGKEVVVVTESPELLRAASTPESTSTP